MICNQFNYYQNKFDTAACIGLIVKIEISIINIF